MKAFTRILCPVDFSEFSGRALRWALAVGGRYGAAVAALAVRPVQTTGIAWAAHGVTFPPMPLESREEMQQHLEGFVRDATGSGSIDPILADGSVVREILRVAGEWRSDLLVMGTHGASGFERLLLGSVTEKVLRRTTIPVLTIPHGAPDRPEATFSTILCAVDRSEAATRALHYALDLARDCRGRLVLAHVVEHVLDEEEQFAHHFDTEACYREIEPQLRQWYAARVPEHARSSCELDVQLRFGKASREVLKIAQDSTAELIAVGTAGASAIFGSTAHQIVRAAEVPVLVVPPA